MQKARIVEKDDSFALREKNVVSQIDPFERTASLTWFGQYLEQQIEEMARKTRFIEAQDRLRIAEARQRETEMREEMAQKEAEQNAYWKTWSNEYKRQAIMASEDQRNTLQDLKATFATEVAKLNEQYQENATRMRNEIETLKVCLTNEEYDMQLKQLC